MVGRSYTKSPVKPILRLSLLYRFFVSNGNLDSLLFDFIADDVNAV